MTTYRVFKTCRACSDLTLQIKDIAPWDTHCLTPDKLAAFYRLVGGNYDPLFLETPHATLSFIYQSLGCFHTLQPTSDPFAPPSLPALTPDGFARWQTIELLLGPEEHVPFLQKALKRFDIVNPASGEHFPKDLSRACFPAVPDESMTRWHEGVWQMLKQEAESEQKRLASGADGVDYIPGVEHAVEERVRVPVDDIPDYFSRSRNEARHDYAHVYPRQHSDMRDRYQNGPRSHTDRPRSHDPEYAHHASKYADRHHHHRSPHDHHRSSHRSSKSRSRSPISSDSDSDSDESDHAPGRRSHHSNSHSRTRTRTRDPDHLFPPTTYRDRRHSHHGIHEPRTTTPNNSYTHPAPQPQYTYHIPPRHIQIPPRQDYSSPPPPAARTSAFRAPQAHGGRSFSDSAPSSPGGYQHRVVDGAGVGIGNGGGRDTVAVRRDREVGRRFVGNPVRGVGGRLYVGEGGVGLLR